MAELTEDIIGKLIAMAESFQDVKQQVQQAAQSAEQAVQEVKTIGQTQSDFVSRFASIDQDSVKADESMRAQAARGNNSWAFKTNVYDFGQAKELVTASQQLSMHQANLNASTIKLVNVGVDAYAKYLHGQVGLDTRYANAKWQQELRHSDIASENQWEDEKELAGSVAALEAAKSTQVPPAVTEEK